MEEQRENKESAEYVDKQGQNLKNVKEDGNKVTVRMLLHRLEFSKVIGKSGQTISHIRSVTGANIKGVDITDELKMITTIGTVIQTTNSFELIADILHHHFVLNQDIKRNYGQNQAHLQSLKSCSSDSAESGLSNERKSGACEGDMSEAGPNAGVLPNTRMSTSAALETPFTINLLFEHNKIGKIVGLRGTTLQHIKQQSRVRVIAIDKEPKDYDGLFLRKMAIEGTLGSLKRAYGYIVEQLIHTTACDLSGGFAFGNSGMNSGFGHGGGYPGAQHTGGAGLAQPFAQYTLNNTVFYEGGYQQQQALSGYCPPSNSFDEYALSAHSAGAGRRRSASGESSHHHTPRGHITGGGGGGQGGRDVVLPVGGVESGKDIVPLPALVQFGIQPETVDQLCNMQAYLAQYFGLDLFIAKRPPTAAAVGGPGMPFPTLPTTMHQQQQQVAHMMQPPPPPPPQGMMVRPDGNFQPSFAPNGPDASLLAQQMMAYSGSRDFQDQQHTGPSLVPDFARMSLSQQQPPVPAASSSDDAHYLTGRDSSSGSTVGGGGFGNYGMNPAQQPQQQQATMMHMGGGGVGGGMQMMGPAGSFYPMGLSSMSGDGTENMNNNSSSNNGGGANRFYSLPPPLNMHQMPPLPLGRTHQSPGGQNNRSIAGYSGVSRSGSNDSHSRGNDGGIGRSGSGSVGGSASMQQQMIQQQMQRHTSKPLLKSPHHHLQAQAQPQSHPSQTQSPAQSVASQRNLNSPSLTNSPGGRGSPLPVSARDKSYSSPACAPQQPPPPQVQQPPTAQSQPLSTPQQQQPVVPSSNVQDIQQLPTSSLIFYIPTSCAGGIIGKRSCNLKLLQTKFNVRIYIEKETVTGVREVNISYTANASSPKSPVAANSVTSGGADSVSTDVNDDAYCVVHKTASIESVRTTEQDGTTTAEAAESAASDRASDGTTTTGTVSEDSSGGTALVQKESHCAPLLACKAEIQATVQEMLKAQKQQRASFGVIVAADDDDDDEDEDDDDDEEEEEGAENTTSTLTAAETAATAVVEHAVIV